MTQYGKNTIISVKKQSFINPFFMTLLLLFIGIRLSGENQNMEKFRSKMGKNRIITEKPEFPTEDIVIAAVSLTDEGITNPLPVNPAKQDCSTTFQEALDFVGNMGGGTVFVPEGFYRLDKPLLIPKSVTLRGRWRKPEKNKTVVGTVLMAYPGRGKEKGNPFITVSLCGGIKDMTIWYPEQKADNITPYPFTLFQKGGNNATFENITLVNSYQGIKIGPTANELHYVHNVFGTPLKVGVWYDSTTDIGRIENVHFSPDFWSKSGLPDAPSKGGAHEKWIYKNGTGLHMFRSDWEYVSYVNIEGYNRGFHISQGVRGAANAQFFALKMNKCRIAIEVEKTNPYGMVFTKCDFGGNEYGININKEFNSSIMFESCKVFGQTAINSEGNGNILVQNSSISSNINIAEGVLVLSNCKFTKPGSKIILGKMVKGASLTGLTGNPEIVNKSLSGKLIQNPDVLKLHTIPEYKVRSDKKFKPEKPNLYVVTDKKWGACADGKTDDTKAIQATIDAAAKDGGGIVFFPAGNYIIKGNLSIPSKVELRGIHDVPHHTIGNGSILHIFPSNNEPTIVLNGDSGMRGLSFNYPEQNINDVKKYPFLLQGKGGNIYIINVNCSNPYKFLDLMTFQCDKHYVDYLSGGPLKEGIKVGGGSQNGIIRNMQFNPHYWNRVDRNNPLFKFAPKGGIRRESGRLYWNFQKDNMNALTVGHTVNQFLFQNFVFGSLYGISFTEEHDAGPENCIVHGHGTDGSKVGINFKSGNDSIYMVNSELVAMASTDKIAIKLNQNFTGKAILFNTMIWGNPDFLAEINNGELIMQGGNAFRHGNGIKANSGNVRIFNIVFAAKKGNHLSISKENAKAEIIGCVTMNRLLLDNKPTHPGVINDNRIKLSGNIVKHLPSKIKSK